MLLRGDHARAEQCVDRWQRHFGGRFYIELQRTERENEDSYNQGALRLAAKKALPVVATNDVRFIDAQEFEAHEVRVCINQGRVLSDPRRPRLYSEKQYLRPAQEMAELYADVPAALRNSVEIAKRCNVRLAFGKSVLPEFPTGELTTDQFLHQQARQGLAQRQRQIQALPAAPDADQYQRRLNTELNVIERMGYSGYFLIVADFTRWARENAVPVGPGRGSGAGSLVAYVLGITDIDPLKYNLLFERFLNPERVSMPDFDIRFLHGRA